MLASFARSLNAPLISAALLTLFCVGLYHCNDLSLLDPLEQMSIDARFHLRGQKTVHPDIVIVAIDDETRAQKPALLQDRQV